MGRLIQGKMPGSSMDTSKPNWTMVDTVDSTAPIAAAAIICGCCLAAWPMAKMVAVLETKPPAKPVSAMPARKPKVLFAM